MDEHIVSAANAQGDYADSQSVYDAVKDYYGVVLNCTADLKTSACCAIGKPPTELAKIIRRIPDEILSKFYGCGTPIHVGIEGCTVLDLGSGSGRDCYIAAALVGESGNVIGLDMTAAQLETARAHADAYCRDTLGYKRTNMRYVEGFMELLDVAGIADATVDIVISNCVLNLSPNKHRVLEQVHRVLKDGGEFFFSDVFADRRLPQHVRTNKILLGECIGGALYTTDFVHLAKRVGFADPRRVSVREIPVDDEDMKALLGNVRFYSITWRLFKIGDLEPECEDYGQIATYKGTIAGESQCYALDDGHLFESNRPERVCGNTALMLTKSWLGKHFTVHGSFDQHFGTFPCGVPTLASQTLKGQASSSASSSGAGSGSSCCAPGSSCC